jgi:hypothetical protein
MHALAASGTGGSILPGLLLAVQRSASAAHQGEAFSMQRGQECRAPRRQPADRSTMEVDRHLLRPCTRRLH